MNDDLDIVREDDVLASMASLPALEPDPWTEQRIRQNSRDVYLEHCAVSTWSEKMGHLYYRLEPAMAFSFGAIYFTWALSRAIGLLR